MTELQLTVTFPNGKQKKFPRPWQLKDIVKDPEMDESFPYVVDFENNRCKVPTKSLIVAARVNKLVRNLNSFVNYSKAHIEPIYASMSVGHEIVRHTILFVFGMACSAILPKTRCSVEHHLGNGYFCELEGHDGVTEELCGQILAKMKEIAEGDHSIGETTLSNEEAIEYFTNVSYRPYTVGIIKSHHKPEVQVDYCNGFYEYHHKVLASSTGLVKGMFDLIPKAHGLKLKFPENPFALHYAHDTDEFLNIYKEYNAWAQIQGVSCAGELNELISNKGYKRFIMLAQALHDQKIIKMASEIFEKKNDLKLILIAGPSASGKTTFSKKLSIQLEILGIRPIVLSVDDYYKPNSECPRDEHGNYDFERLDALRVELLNDHLVQLFNGEEVETPLFDFKAGKPKPVGKKLRMTPGSILVMEGIHCLNPELTPKVSRDHKFQIFMAPLSPLNVDEMNFIPHAITRLMRRILRDFNDRGSGVQRTLDMWPAVRKAEHKYIFPFLKNADVVFNSALDYEIPVLAVYVRSLLEAIPPTDDHFSQARDLLEMLSNFHTIPEIHVPSDSLLREFIGGSIFE